MFKMLNQSYDDMEESNILLKNEIVVDATRIVISQNTALLPGKAI